MTTSKEIKLKWLPLGYLTEPELARRVVKYHQDLLNATKMNIPRSQVIFRLLRIALDKEGH